MGIIDLKAAGLEKLARKIREQQVEMATRIIEIGELLQQGVEVDAPVFKPGEANEIIRLTELWFKCHNMDVIIFEINAYKGYVDKYILGACYG